MNAVALSSFSLQASAWAALMPATRLVCSESSKAQ
jgi:hypothetical protein